MDGSHLWPADKHVINQFGAPGAPFQTSPPVSTTSVQADAGIFRTF